MTIMTATAVGFFGESFFLGATGPVMLLCRWDLFARCRVVVEGAELLAAFPAPGTATARSYREAAARLKTTRKDIVTGGVFQCPALTPRALLCICRHSFL